MSGEIIAMPNFAQRDAPPGAAGVVRTIVDSGIAAASGLLRRKKQGKRSPR